MAFHKLLQELQDMVMEFYVAKQHPVITCRRSNDLESKIAEIESEMSADFLWNDLRATIQTALFTASVFKLRFVFSDPHIVDGEIVGTAQIPDSTAGFITRVRNLEITFPLYAFPHNVARTLPLLGAAYGIAPLAPQLPMLQRLTIHLIVNVSRMRDDKARSGTWIDKQSMDGVYKSNLDPAYRLPTTPPHRAPRLRDHFDFLIQSAKVHGPGKTKVFKLSIQRQFPAFGKQYRLGPDCKCRAHSWKAWVQHCDGLEFQSLDDASGLLEQALQSCVESPLTEIII